MIRQILALMSLVLVAASPIKEHGQDALITNSLSTLQKLKKEIFANPRQAVEQARQFQQDALQIVDWKKRALVIALAERLEAEALIEIDDTDQAKVVILSAQRKIYSILPRSRMMAEILLTKGGVQAAKQQAADALRSYQISFEIFGKFNDRRNQAVALVYIASLYNRAKDNISALKYYDQALDFAGNDASLRFSIQNNRGIVFQDVGDYKSAISAFLRAIALADAVGNRQQAKVWTNIARSRLADGQLKKAKQDIDIGWQFASLPGAEGEKMVLIAVRADIALKMGHVNEAARLVDQNFAGIDPAKTITPLYRRTHDVAYRVYEALGRSDLAFAHLLALKRIDDEATKLAISTSTALMGARFDFANQELRIATLRAEELRRSVAFEQARAHAERLLFLGGAGATAIIIGLLAFGLVTIQRSRNDVRAANIDLERTNAALAKALAAKTEFLATTSHEIRTPLNGILGMAQVMLADPGIAADLRDRLSIVQGAGMTMKALVDDILDVAKLETGKVTIEDIAFDMAHTIGDAAALWEEQARLKGLSFTVDLAAGPTMVMGDPARLRQIVFNLIGNAMKFTATGSIAVTAAIDPDDENYHVSVTDSGIGIAPEQQALIFEAFRQADAGTTRLYGGTGLGLSICRNLARAMGGDVTVASRMSEGATFTLTLPLRRAQPVDASSNPAANVPGGSLLVVERNPIARGMWRGLLDSHVSALAFAGSVAEAVEMLGSGGVAAMLVDDATVRHEPDTELAVTRLIAAAGTAAASTTLLWAGDDVPGDAAGAATRILRKPLSGATLVAALFGEPSERDLVLEAV